MRIEEYKGFSFYNINHELPRPTKTSIRSHSELTNHSFLQRILKCCTHPNQILILISLRVYRSGKKSFFLIQWLAMFGMHHFLVKPSSIYIVISNLVIFQDYAFLGNLFKQLLKVDIFLLFLLMANPIRSVMFDFNCKFLFNVLKKS